MVGGIYEEKGGKQLCHVFAGGKRLATFEPGIGGPYASVFAPKQWWAQTSEAMSAAADWPFQQRRTPITVLITTLLGVLLLSISARRGWNWNLGTRIFRMLAQFLPKVGMALPQLRDVRAAFSGATPPAIARAGSSQRDDPTRVRRNSDEPSNPELTPREHRWYRQPLWRHAVSVFMIVALVFTTTPTEVEAQTYNPVFYYLGYHLGSSNVMTNRAG